MGWTGRIVSGALVAMLVGACGGSSHTASTDTSTSPPATPTSTTPAKPPSGLAAHVLTNNELAGFTAPEPPIVERNVRAYLIETQTPSSQLASETARLTRLGFLGAVDQNLGAAGSQGGLSLVEQFRTRQGAQAEMAHELGMNTHLPGTRYRTFPVTGIPGAVGFALVSPQGAGINITFVDGPYYYVVGEALGGPLSAGAEAKLNAGARHLYQRVHG